MTVLGQLVGGRAGEHWCGPANNSYVAGLEVTIVSYGSWRSRILERMALILVCYV